MTWLDGFQRVTWSHTPGQDFTQAPRGVCFHTTQGSTAQGAFSVYATRIACPHMTVEYDEAARYQHVPLDKSAYSLQRGDRQHICGVQTNRSGIIQIEIVGFAQDAWAWTPAELEWLGTQVLAPILEACPTIPHAVYHGVRMNESQWAEWPGGLCGHRDVCCQPDGHWDPGDANLDAVLDYALGAMTMPTPAEIWAYPLTIEGFTAPAGEWLGYLYAEITRTADEGGQLMKNIEALIDEKVLLIDGP